MSIGRLALAALSATGALMLGAVQAQAAPMTDTVEAPTGYFVPTDGQKYDPTYYRSAGQDWGWTHTAILSPFATASLNISAFDVDYNGTASGELDAVYAEDEGVRVFLGYLTGSTDTWAFGNSFNLGANFFDDIAEGLNVWIDIDSANSGWALTLGKSSLSIDGGGLPPPDPGAIPEPATWAMMIMGFGAAGSLFRRRRFVAA